MENPERSRMARMAGPWTRSPKMAVGITDPARGWLWKACRQHTHSQPQPSRVGLYLHEGSSDQQNHTLGDLGLLRHLVTVATSLCAMECVTVTDMNAPDRQRLADALNQRRGDLNL